MRATHFVSLMITSLTSSLVGQIPNATKLVVPRYPEAALASNQQGAIRFELDLNSDGTVNRANVLESFTYTPATLKQVAETISKWQFKPGTSANQSITIEFQILLADSKNQEESIEVSSSGYILIKARPVRSK